MIVINFFENSLKIVSVLIFIFEALHFRPITTRLIELDCRLSIVARFSKGLVPTALLSLFPFFGFTVYIFAHFENFILKLKLLQSLKNLIL